MKQTLKALGMILLVTAISACSDSDPVQAETTAPPVDAPAIAVEEGVTAPEAEAETADEESPPSEQDQAAETTEPGSLPVAVRRWVGDLDVLEERRVVRVLTVYGPGRFHLEEGRGRGVVAEMTARYEQFLNDNLDRNHVKVLTMVIPMARDQLIPALLDGRGDIIMAGLTITDERRELVDFSIPSSKPLNEILVTGPSAPAIESLDDLAGQILYLREDSSYRQSAAALSERLVAKGLEPVTIKAMEGSLEDDDLIEMVNAGLLPWAVVDDYKPQLWEGVFTELVVRDDLVLREGGRIGWAIRKNSPLLKASVDAFLKDNREGTLFGNMMVNRYVRDFDWAANALGDEDYQRFNDLQHIFQRYGERYGIEYLFAAAQGYQESRLDQSVRSKAGAIGVMQLLPETAADKNVDIPDIHDVDSNIHAGIKYMDFLRDRYFSEQDITPLNQALLALGAYNAGPGRMIRMRAKAAERGYDPNVWFDNVEIIAAEEIGRETVQYVANIFRYYLTYRMVANQELRHGAAREAAGISAVPEL